MSQQQARGLGQRPMSSQQMPPGPPMQQQQQQQAGSGSQQQSPPGPSMVGNRGGPVHGYPGPPPPQQSPLLGQPSGPGPQQSGPPPPSLQIPYHLYQLVQDLTDPVKREKALPELSRKREEFPDLAPILWHSYGTIAALLQEIVPIYPLLSPPNLTTTISNRCCNALALLQCVASHPETRGLFLTSHLGLFLYPFLNTQYTHKPYEYLRLTSLGVIGALVKMDDSEVISFLLQTEIIPLCLRIMDTGSELSKTVATFIIQKILLDDMGLNYVCATYERFSTVSNVLKKMVIGLTAHPSQRLLKHIVACYLRLSEYPRAREELRSVLPEQLRNNSFVELLQNEETTKRWLGKLLYNIDEGNQRPFEGLPPQQ